MPNPNVLIEYGRASVRPGSECVIQVFNAAFGDWESERPFDLRHRRKPLLYNLPENPTPEQKSLARRELVSQLTGAIRTILEVPRASVSMPEVTAFEPLREFYRRTSFREKTSGRIIGFWCALIPYDQTVKLAVPWEKRELVERLSTHSFQLGHDTVPFAVMDADLTQPNANFAPMKGGARYTRQYRYFCGPAQSRSCDDAIAIYVMVDGRVVIAVRTNNLGPVPHLQREWIMADVANALLIADRVRGAAGCPNASYALFVELRYDDQSEEGFSPVKSGEWRLSPLGDEAGNTGPFVPSDPLAIGPIAVGPEVLPENVTGLR
jgi:hypothetical protein